MKIQEASKDFNKEGIMFPSSKTSYIEENTPKGKENNTENTLKHPGAPQGR